MAAVVEAHGGRLELHALSEGGLQVAIELPLAPWARRSFALRVLVVEDSHRLADVVAEGLRDQGMAVDVAYDGARLPESSTSTPTTSSCWTVTCPGFTETRSVE